MVVQRVVPHGFWVAGTGNGVRVTQKTASNDLNLTGRSGVVFSDRTVV